METIPAPSEPLPRGFDRREAVRLFALTEAGRDLPRRIDLVSHALLGRSYQADPLVGGPERPEVFVADLSRFDCVTFIETVLAIAMARSVDELPQALRGLRYAHERVAWLDRNHYMTDWLIENGRGGRISIVPPAQCASVQRVLSSLQGYPSRRREIRYCATADLEGYLQTLLDGDVLCFISTREDLDIFHVGIAVHDGKSGLLLRHASKSRGAVVEEPLADFLARNEMPGVLAARGLSAPRMARTGTGAKRKA